MCDLVVAAAEFRQAKTAAKRSATWGRVMTAACGVYTVLNGWAVFGVGIDDVGLADAPANEELARVALHLFGLSASLGHVEADYTAAVGRLRAAALGGL